MAAWLLHIRCQSMTILSLLDTTHCNQGLCSRSLACYATTASKHKASQTLQASPDSIIARRCSYTFLICLWGVKSSGRAVMAWPTLLRMSGLTPAAQHHARLMVLTTHRIKLFVPYATTNLAKVLLQNTM